MVGLGCVTRVVAVGVTSFVFLLPGSLAAGPEPPNILVLIIDDLGIEHVGPGFSDSALTPNLGALAAQGLVFENAWAYPLCSTTRAASQTGRHPLRNGVGKQIGIDFYSLSPDELSLADLLTDTHTTASFGKWHLGSYDSHPGDMGYDHYEVVYVYNQADLRWDWFEHVWTVNGTNETRGGYMTEELIDSTVAWIEAQSEPWLAWVAPLSVHAPLHCPPEELHGFGDCAPNDHLTQYQAMIEALDTLVDPLFEAVDMENTVVFVYSDNGSFSSVLSPPFVPPGKGSVTQAGINVPMVVAGPDVAIGTTDRLVSVVDLFATIAGLTETALPAIELDSVDFGPILLDPETLEGRGQMYSETYDPNGAPFPYDSLQMAARDDRYKLSVVDGSIRLHDLEVDPYELEGSIWGI